MRIEINQHISGTGAYSYYYADGSEEWDEYKGEENSLEEVFEKIIEHRKSLLKYYS